MKKFLCADIVPECGQAIRAANTSDVAAQAAEHLTSAHGLAITDKLRADIEHNIRAVSLLDSLLHRS